MKRLLPINSRNPQAGRRRLRPAPPSLAELAGLEVRRMLRIVPTLLWLAVRWKVRTAPGAWLFWAVAAVPFGWADYTPFRDG